MHHLSEEGFIKAPQRLHQNAATGQTWKQVYPRINSTWLQKGNLQYILSLLTLFCADFSESRAKLKSALDFKRLARA